jgi:hypothetical protein
LEIKPMTDDKRLRYALWTVAAVTVLYVLSIGPAFRYARRSCFAYYQPVPWLVHETQYKPIMDGFCAYLNWWSDL